MRDRRPRTLALGVRRPGDENDDEYDDDFADNSNTERHSGEPWWRHGRRRWSWSWSLLLLLLLAALLLPALAILTRRSRSLLLPPPPLLQPSSQAPQLQAALALVENDFQGTRAYRL